MYFYITYTLLTKEGRIQDLIASYDKWMSWHELNKFIDGAILTNQAVAGNITRGATIDGKFLETGEKEINTVEWRK